MRKLEKNAIKNDLFIKKEIDSLIRSKIYKKEDDVIVDALKALLEKKSQLRQEIAVDLYKNNDVSLWRASEIARMNIEEFKNILISKGTKILV